MTEAARDMTNSSNTSQPFFVGHDEFRRLLGNIGKTTGYELISRHGVKVVRLGSRAMIPFSEVARVRDELMQAAETPKPVKGGRTLAATSVAARKAKNPSAETKRPPQHEPWRPKMHPSTSNRGPSIYV